MRGEGKDGFRLQVSEYRLVRSVGRVPLEYVGVEVVYCALFQVPSFRWEVEGDDSRLSRSRVHSNLAWITDTLIPLTSTEGRTPQ